MPFRYTHRLLYTSVLFPVKFFVTVNLLYYLYIFPLEDESKKRDLSSVKCESLVGVQGSLFTQSLSNLKEVWRLDSLVRAHTLLAVMADKTSPEHQLNLLRAYTFVLRIWQVHCPITGNRQCGWGCSSNANYVWVELWNIYIFAVCVLFVTAGVHGSMLWDFQWDGNKSAPPASSLCWIQKRKRQKSERCKSYSSNWIQSFVDLLSI